MSHRLLANVVSTSYLGAQRASCSAGPSLSISGPRLCHTQCCLFTSQARRPPKSSSSPFQIRSASISSSSSAPAEPQSRKERISNDAIRTLGDMVSSSSKVTTHAPIAPRRPAPAPAPSPPTLPPSSVATSFIYTSTALPPKQDALVSFFVGVLMKDGKRAMAERHVSEMLAALSAATNRAPLPLLEQAVRSASPLVRMQTSRKGGGKIEQVPIPLNERQSTRRAIANIIDASKKRSEREISRRLAREVLAVLEGSSVAVQKREEAHKVAVANRANASVRI